MYSKEERREHNKKYKENNSEKVRDQQLNASRRWRENNPERYRQQNLHGQKKYYERVKYDEEFREQRRQYAKQYRERMKNLKNKKGDVIFKGSITISFN